MTVRADLPLTAAVAALAAGEVSPTELVHDALQRAHAAPGAFVAIDEAGACRAAARPQAGPLHGVPVAVKDMVDVAGLPTRGGSEATSDSLATADAPIVVRLRAAGAVIVGKTATHELAYGVTTPAVTNPRHPALTAGGSSGGSAAAVAAGIVPLALGTDTTGSVRIPAACCGVCGMIGPPQCLPGAGVIPLSASFDTLGPIVAEPGDVSLAWAALCGGGEVVTGDPSRPARLRREEPLRRVRVVPAELLGRIHPEALAWVHAIAERLGVPIEQAAPPPFTDWGAPRAIVVADEALRAHRALGLYPDRAADLGPEIREAHAAAAARPPEQVDAARAQLAGLARGLRAAVGAGEILLTPALPSAPPDRSEPNLKVVGRLTRLVAPVNAAGLAAAVVPEGPCGVQLVATEVPTLLAALGRL